MLLHFFIRAVQPAHLFVARAPYIQELYLYGVRGVTHDWFRDYLTNRQQFTSLSGINSSFAYLACGVPQGSVLGPLLFLIYVCEVPMIYSQWPSIDFVRRLLIAAS